MYEAWLAMGIDCDGTISKPESDVSVSFANTHEGIVDAFEQRTNLLGCRTRRGREDRTAPHSTCYSVTISGTRQKHGLEDKLKFLRAILPHLIRKREIAELAIETLELRVKARETIRVERVMEPGLLYTTAELAKLAGVPRAKAYGRMFRLSRKGLVEKRSHEVDTEKYWMLKVP